MTTITITIQVDPDEATQVRLATPTNGHALQAAAAAIFQDELEPLPPEPGTTEEGYLGADPLAPSARRGMAVVQTGCRVHHVPWKLVPAGVSKKTGKPYDEFLACPERGCDQRP